MPLSHGPRRGGHRREKPGRWLRCALPAAPRALCWRPTNWSRPLLSFAAESRNWEERFCLASEEPPVSSESVMMFTVCRVLGAARRARRDGRRVERWNVCARVPLSLRRQSGAKRRPRARANPGCAIQPPALPRVGDPRSARAPEREGRRVLCFCTLAGLWSACGRGAPTAGRYAWKPACRRAAGPSLGCCATGMRPAAGYRISRARGPACVRP